MQQQQQQQQLALRKAFVFACSIRLLTVACTFAQDFSPLDFLHVLICLEQFGHVGGGGSNDAAALESPVISPREGEQGNVCTSLEVAVSSTCECDILSG